MRVGRSVAAGVLAVGAAFALAAGPAAGKKKASAPELAETSRTVGGVAEETIAAGGSAVLAKSGEAIGLCLTLAVGAGPINVELLTASAVQIERQVEPGTTETVCGTVDQVQLSCASTDDCTGRWRLDRR